jgi:hypothetical protein
MCTHSEHQKTSFRSKQSKHFHRKTQFTSCETGSNKVKLPKVESNAIVSVPVGAEPNKVRKTLAPEPWVCSYTGEIQEKRQFHPFFSFFLSVSIAGTHIFTASTCTTTIVTLEPCALNTEFQHFMLRFNKISLLCGYHWKGMGVKRGPKTEWLSK